jgi:hypothetical protein
MSTATSAHEGLRQTSHKQATHKYVEGGLFYPTGYIVAAFPDASEALQVQRDLVTGGYDAEHDCVYSAPETVADEAEDDVHHKGGLRVLFGHSLHTRDTHLALAHEGCHFLTIHASTQAEEQRVIRVMSRVPVRHAIKYHLFVVEDITNKIASAVREALVV